MLIKKNPSDNSLPNPNWKYLGKDDLTGYDKYLVPVRENNSPQPKVEWNIDDYLSLDDDEDYSDYDWYDVEDATSKEKGNFSKSDFYQMDYRDSLYQLYLQL